MKNTQRTPLTILLVDDDKDDRYFFARALKELPIPYQFQTVSDGEQLMNHLNVNSERLPDVIFLDLNMPRKNGHECLAEIKEHKKWKKIPVIIYSTSLRDEVLDMLYNTGAHYFLHKCGYVELIQFLHRAITLLQENAAQPPKNKFVINK